MMNKDTYDGVCKRCDDTIKKYERNRQFYKKLKIFKTNKRC